MDEERIQADVQAEDEQWQLAAPDVVKRLAEAQTEYLQALGGFELDTDPRPSSLPDITNLGFLRDRRFRVRKPIKVKFSVEDELEVAEAVGLNEFGYGHSRNEALGDLQQALVTLYEQLSANQDTLGGDLQQVWQALTKSVEFNER